MSAIRPAALLAALTLSVAAQAQTKGHPAQQPAAAAVPTPRQEKIFPLGATWTAVSLNGKPFSGDRPSFTLDQQYRARGFGGCNTYSATAYPLRQQHLAVGPFALTKRACDKDAAAIERAFLVALRTAVQWEMDGSTLIVKTQNGELRFERAL
jgi:heat shock protein HslJ